MLESKSETKILDKSYLYLFLCFMVELVGKSCEVVANVLEEKENQNPPTAFFENLHQIVHLENLTHRDPDWLTLARPRGEPGEGKEESNCKNILFKTLRDCANAKR